MANHIIQQDEDKANILLCAIRVNKQNADRWKFDVQSCLTKDLG
jgi:hypothetical protein